MIYEWDLTIPELSGEKKRRAYLYLPDSYFSNPAQRFPVMYMFDGHNVFFNSDATYGKCWGMAQYLQRSKKQLIVVAVECNHEGNRRLVEYSPVDFENATLGKIRGKGRVYMNWLVKTLKPAIDARLRTLPDRSHTYICGSSMGGLMSIYAAVHYNKFFQRAACLSPSVWVAPEKLANMIVKSRMRPDTCIYMDYGSRELYNHDTNTEALVGVMDQLLRKQVNLTFRIVPGGTHSEASWEKQIPMFMDCLQI